MIEEFVTGAPPSPVTDRVLATVLFTDIVDSTRLASDRGDAGWRQLLDQHDDALRREVGRYGGRIVHGTGDGLLATFDSPSRAIRAAHAGTRAVEPLGLRIRAGLHTGEIERRGDDIAGIAVHLGQRISGRAGPRQVLVSRTVADLVAGSDIELHDEGEHELKGISGTTHLFSVMRA